VLCFGYELVVGVCGLATWSWSLKEEPAKHLPFPFSHTLPFDSHSNEISKLVNSQFNGVNEALPTLTQHKPLESPIKFGSHNFNILNIFISFV